MINANPATWPTGDVFYSIAHAIAHAEGADVWGSVPDRLNNPGDISDGLHIFDSQHHDGSEVTRFPDKEIGWTWLHDKLHNIARDISSIYRPYETWREIAHKWAGDSENWLKNVCGDYEFQGLALGLKVSPDSTFEQFIISYTEDFPK